MDPGWLSNAYLVADEEGGTAVYVDSGAPLEPLLQAVEEWGVTPTQCCGRMRTPTTSCTRTSSACLS